MRGPEPTRNEPSVDRGRLVSLASPPVIGLAHGSRHPGVRASIEALMAAVAAAGKVPAGAAYLDLTAPDLAAATAALVRDGFERAVVVPLLFTSAYHATVDVPATVRAAGDASGLRLSIAAILGTGTDVRDALLAAATAANVGPDEPVLLFAVGSSDEHANDAVRDLAGQLAASRTGPVGIGFGTARPGGADVLNELAAEGAKGALLPLFVAPGLLLDPMDRLARDRGWTSVPPLGVRMAPLVLARYRAACRAESESCR